jgi:UPF0755 protein
MKRSILITIAIIITTLFLYLAKTEIQYQNYLSASVDSDSTARITFRVEKEEKVKSIAKRLVEEEIIPSDWAFYKYVKRNDVGPLIEAGKFILKKSYTIPEIADFLTSARTDEISVTIREGLTLKQVDKYLAEEEILEEGEFLNCIKTCEFSGYFFLEAQENKTNLEGYLFADTYFLDPESTDAHDIIEKMLINFETKLSSQIRSDIAASGKSIHEIITMASLIEKESRNEEEKGVISGILWKRLEIGMPLGVDATVRYATGKWTEPLSYDDLEIDSPYNTRNRRGLPPNPISNFSLESLQAAVNYQESPYLFYLHSDDGQIHYAETNEQHNENKRKFL